MTTPTFVINSTITAHGVVANWQRVVKRQNADGTTTYQPYWLHTWDIAQMEMTTFLGLQALQGQALTSLATTTVTDRNNAATYTSVTMSLVSGQHTGRRVTGVRLEFRVKP